MADLQNEIIRLRQEIAGKPKEAEKPVPPPPVVKPQEFIAPEPVKEKPVFIPLLEKPKEELKPALDAPEPQPEFEERAIAPAQIAPRSQKQYVPPAPQESWFDKWLRDNPDMEKFIGENLINKIGIGILVLGIGFFVKYAIDQDWIKEIGRVCIGLFCGALLIGLAHRLRKNYHSFSSVLVGGGLAIFYFTIALAFHTYGLFSQTAAFIIMVVITIFAVVLSILYDRMEIGIIAAVGGFLTPFLVSTGEGNYIVLFTYLSILNAGLIVLAYYKRWRVLNFIAFVFTEAIYLSWIGSRAGETGFSYTGTFIFGCVFYAMFVLMNVIHHVSRGSRLTAFDFIILLSVNLCFYSAGIYLLGNGGMADYKGLFTASLGVINLVLGWIFFKQSKADRNFIYLIIAITVTYISLAGPVQLNGHYITLFWAAETVALLWLYQRSFIKLLKWASLLITVLMLISLFMDWAQVYGFNSPADMALPVIINKGFITGVVCAVAMLCVYTLLRKEADTYYLPGFTNTFTRQFYLTISIALLFIAGVLEVNWQFAAKMPGTGIQFIYLQLYVAAFAVIFIFICDKLNIAISSIVRMVLPFVIFILYVLNAANIYVAEKAMLTSGNNKLHFMAALASVIFILVLAYSAIGYVRKNEGVFKKSMDLFAWVTTIALIILFSLEARNLFVWFYYYDAHSLEYAENLYSKAGLSIVWGLSSFITIWLGLNNKYKPLRIIGLVVFGVTLVKLFAFDIRNIPAGGKILAFILLGVVLLVVSFMYQRIKKLIIDDKSNPQ